MTKPSDVIVTKLIVRCDNKACDFECPVPSEYGTEIIHFHDMPCPKCGDNLLNDEQLSDALEFSGFVISTNEIARAMGVEVKNRSEIGEITGSPGETMLEAFHRRIAEVEALSNNDHDT